MKIYNKCLVLFLFALLCYGCTQQKYQDIVIYFPIVDYDGKPQEFEPAIQIWLDDIRLLKYVDVVEVSIEMSSTCGFDEPPDIIFRPDIILADKNGKIFKRVALFKQIAQRAVLGPVPYECIARFQIPDTSFNEPLIVTIKGIVEKNEFLFQRKFVSKNGNSGDAIPNSKK